MSDDRERSADARQVCAFAAQTVSKTVHEIMKRVNQDA